MALSKEYVAYLEDLFDAVPEAAIRRMFGGAGVFRQGLMFGLATSEGMVALKADEKTMPTYKAAGATEWVYRNKAGREMRMGYWYVPESVLEDHETFAQWADAAFDAARRGDAKKPPSQRKYSG